jgi:hypothetical protein
MTQVSDSTTRPLFRVAAIFGLAGAAMLALGIVGLLNLIRGGIGLGIFAVATGVLGLGIAGYLVWARNWLRTNRS